MKVTNTIPSVICECGLITLKLICFNRHNSVVLSHAHMGTHVTEFPIQSSMLYVFSWLCLLIGFLLFVFTLVVLSPMCLSSFTLVVPVFRDGVCAFVFFLPFFLELNCKTDKALYVGGSGVCLFTVWMCVFFQVLQFPTTIQKHAWSDWFKTQIMCQVSVCVSCDGLAACPQRISFLSPF